MAAVAVGANMCLSVSSRATKTGQMAISTPLQFPFTSTLGVRSKLPSTCALADSRPSLGSECSLLYGNTHRQSHVVRAVEESQESTETDVQNSDTVKEVKSIDQQPSQSTAELTELGAEIKKALEQRKEKADDNLLSGVVEEIGEIEWPAFGKVLGTTGVVLGVIAGSSVALLTVNAVLAELSDKVFAGKGIQDFFG
ncbi:preprotein translocase subunit SECE1 isoform X2 [Syzygium oleosum]|uniref:preprotein translocase subunit SECE1 isoform X2 n=1 Tax=Syzygium oleosum TaxID=219896 RepID=UPI0024B9CB13|nr:preprotein translocase subunit SECE1 isoform X2 [Syzygium oleosum]XP_056175430.1 preprotein translocase subunit SECE1 isoform X2 [Syzygium oleosum]XP_056175431.1 preprotein translocase subunit SECE1 isoform X2 [Syzygium oleosum]XP_056175432.1 preprotein translocase subunit SECE1 isoform X2 [Syzygium oleosum]